MKVHIDHNYANDWLKMYLVEDEATHLTIIGRVDGKVTAITKNKYEVSQEEPNEIEPFLEMDGHMFRKFSKAFVDELSKSNLQTESESITKGKLEATQKHLEDLQYFSKELLKRV